MNLNNLIRVLSIVCVCIFVEPKAHKGNRCRKFYKQLSAEFDKRFRSLEKKLILQQDVTPNSTRSYRDLVLNSNESLERLKNQIRSQKRSMDNLNGHFGVLENVVKNLTEAIDRLGNMSPPKTVQPAAPEVVTTPAITVSAKTTPEPKRGFPKRKFFYFFNFLFRKSQIFYNAQRHDGMVNAIASIFKCHLRLVPFLLLMVKITLYAIDSVDCLFFYDQFIYILIFVKLQSYFNCSE